VRHLRRKAVPVGGDRRIVLDADVHVAQGADPAKVLLDLHGVLVRPILAAVRVHHQRGLGDGPFDRKYVDAVAVLRVSEPTSAIRMLIEAVGHVHARPDSDGQGNLFDPLARVIAGVPSE